MRPAQLIALSLVVLIAAGCVRRTVSIDSTPRGALVWLNDREVGRTPLDVDFLFYGDYDVRIEHDDAEPVMTGGAARAPIWDVPPLDFVAEMLPVQLHSRIRWHYDLEPRQDEPEAVRMRAAEMRRQASID